MANDMEIKNIYPLTSMQEGMLFHSLKDTGSNSYFQQLSFSVEGELDANIFEKSLNILVERYDVLRTIFKYKNVKRSVQIVLNKRNASLHFEDISQLEDSKKNLFIENYKRRDREKGFDLSKDVLLRVSVLKPGADSYSIIWSFHHIILDGWSLGILINDFFNIYSALRNGRIPEREKLLPYSRYIKWLETQKREEASRYWKEYLEGYNQQAVIPGDKNLSSAGKYVPGQLNFKIDGTLTEGLKNTAVHNHVTLNTVFQAIWGILLMAYNQSDDVVFGSVVSGRPDQIGGVEKMVGLFINTVPVRIMPEEHQSFSRLIRCMQDKALLSKNHEYFSLAEIQSGTVLKHNLIGSIMVFENYPVEKAVGGLNNERDAGFKVNNVEIFEQSNYNVDIAILPGVDTRVRLNYNSAMYDENLIKNIEGHIRQIVRTVVENPDIPVNKIDILTVDEKKRVVFDFNRTDSEYPKRKTIGQLFEEQVKKRPDNIALVYENEKLTYREVNSRASKLAGVLRKKGIVKNSIVGVLLENSAEMVIAIIGILKAGGAYLPIDTEYPADRIRYMIEDSEAAVLVTQRHLADKADFELDSIYMEDWQSFCDDNPIVENISSQEDLVYVIYTSGTTGLPKAVLIENHSLVNYAVWFVKKAGLTDRDKTVLVSSFAFDLGYTSIYPALLSGCELHIVSREAYMDPERLLPYIDINGITYIKATPSLFHIMVNSRGFSVPGCLRSLRFVALGGEKIHVNDIELFNRSYPEAQIMNHYGPTEATIGSIAQIIDFKNFESYKKNPAIGMPIDNTRIYILDRNLRCLPAGVAGEICIAGEGVARGYWKREDLNMQKFVVHTLPYKDEERIYRTGDLGRYLPDGCIEFLGRIDNQVKIRGYRVELREIESRVSNSGMVKDAVVIFREDAHNNAFLCAYVVLKDCFTIKELKQYLKDQLPGYMVPSSFIPLQSIPLTPNGKVDIRSLPEDDGLFISGEEYAPPEDIVEMKLVNIWKSVLNLKQVGVHDNFFDIGGHSLKAATLILHVYKEFGVELPLTEVFDSPTIKELAKYIRGMEAGIYASIQTAEKKAYYKVSSAQGRMFVLNRLEENQTNYNMPKITEVSGAVDRAGFEEIFRQLLQRHETLRTSFELVDGKPVQRIHENVNFKMSYFELNGGPGANGEEDINLKVREIIKGFIQPFDLSTAPLFRAGLIKISGEKHIFMFDMHHIIADGVSSGILMREFIGLYKGDSLPPLRIQYKDFSEWQNEMLNSEAYKKQEKYWLDTLSGKIPVLNMPVDFRRSSVQSYEGSSINFEADKELTVKLYKVVSDTASTLYMVLLAAFNILLSKYTGREDIIIGSPIAGRFHPDLFNTLGVFINTILMRNRPEGDKTCRDFIAEVRENALKAYENQDYQFEELVDRLGVKRDAGKNPLFDVMFEMQNMDVNLENIAGLKFEAYKFENRAAKFDIELVAMESDAGITFSMVYCTQLFKEETAKRLAGDYISILDALAGDIDVKLGMIVPGSCKHLNPEHGLVENVEFSF